MYFLGVESGGTKTTAVLSDIAGATVRTVQMGAGNVSVSGRERTRELINEIVARLLENESIESIRWATLGFAGAGRQAEKQILAEILIRLGLHHFTVMTDAELLYVATFDQDRGMLLISGTGSVCVIRNRQNQFEQIGGWGYILGDEGSGYDIGRMAIRQALFEVESRAVPSALTNELLTFYKCTHPRELVTTLFSKGNPQNRTASCAQLVCQRAAEDDSMAQGIVSSAATSLIQLCQWAIKRMEAGPPIPLSLAGGILHSDSPVTAAFKRQARDLQLDFQYQQPRISPVAAAVLHSVRQSGESVGEGLVIRMQDLNFN